MSCVCMYVSRYVYVWLDANYIFSNKLRNNFRFFIHFLWMFLQSQLFSVSITHNTYIHTHTHTYTHDTYSDSFHPQGSPTFITVHVVQRKHC